MNIIEEPEEKWGGNWTETKLNAFTKYVSSYLTIMKKHPYWNTIYFDGFAGSGDRKKNDVSPLLNQLFPNNQEQQIYKGSAERVLSIKSDLSFDYYYFIDTNKESLDKLKSNLLNYQKNNKNHFQFRHGDCNKYLFELSEAMKRKDKSYAALVFLDPFGMQINWESIESFKNTRTDIWILIPTGVIVNRLLNRNACLIHSNKLIKFFGLSEQEIKDYFYKIKKQNSLFGEQEIIRKVTKPIEKIANLYTERLKTIWKYVTEKPLRLDNTKGVPIFHFVFASNNKNAVKIAKQIINIT